MKIKKLVKVLTMIAIAAVIQIQANKLAAFERHSVDAIRSEVFAFPIVLITEYKVFCTPGESLVEYEEEE